MSPLRSLKMKLLYVSICVQISLIFGLPPGERIIGGSIARAGDFPFAAAIHVITGDGEYFCAGSIVGKQWILTSAYCVVHQIKFFVIQLGSSSLTSGDNRVVVVTTSAISHPDYNANNLENDVGLLRLRKPIKFNDYIRAIELSTQPLEEYMVVTAIGWGQTSDSNSALVDELRYVDLVTMSNAECSEIYHNQIIDGMVCVCGNFNEGACKGDSGGPLVMYLYGKVVAVGIASFFSGNGCESADPSGFTRIYNYIDWISNYLAA